MDEVAKAAWANAKCNDDFICIVTCSGYRITTTDPQGKQHLLPVDVADQELGSAVLDALAYSRFLPPQEQPVEDQALFDVELVEKRYSEWVETLMATYGYKTKRALFKDMANCNIEFRNGAITIRPSHHERLEGWSGDGINRDDHVLISADSPPRNVGAALRLAFSRCT